MSEVSKEVINKLMPQVNEAINVSIDGKIGELTNLLENKVSSKVFDHVITEIASRLNLPKEIIEGLTNIVSKVKDNEDIINNLTNVVAKFKESIKEEDLNKTITMSYWDLIKEKVKSAFYWGISGFLVGILSGIVLAFKFWM